MSDNYLKWLLLGILSLIWGSSFILMKYGLEVYPSGQVGALRILFASVVLLPIALKKIKKLPAKKIKILFISGLLGSFFPAFLFAKAQTEINSSLAGILNTLTPVFVLVTGLVFFKQTSNKQTFYGMALGVIGSVVLISTGNEGLFTDFNYYGLFVITATVLYGFNLNIIKYYLSDIDSLTITSVSLLFLLPLDALYLFLFTPIIEVTTSD
ncbi:MAG: DMT family transporter, partial [Cyclobacteriaceae bacterium]|nr:DMT family transporter [Cyclobacteriaceae bacterium]